jgi:hypothetical protein
MLQWDCKSGENPRRKEPEMLFVVLGLLAVAFVGAKGLEKRLSPALVLA